MQKLKFRNSVRQFVFILCLGVMLPFNVTADENKNSPVTKRTPSDKLEWEVAPFGPEVSKVAGDFASGEHITYIRFAPGMKTPLHIHSADYVGIMISGVSRHWEPGKPATRKKLPTGSHWFIPANVPHVSECLQGLECIMAIVQKEAFDFIPLE